MIPTSSDRQSGHRRVLEQRGYPIGIVDVVAGSGRLRVQLKGRPDHSGGTPMWLRHDALAAGAEVITMVERLGQRYPRGTAATVGRIHVRPNSITTVPGSVELVVDVRDVDEDRRMETVQLVAQRTMHIAEARGIEATVETISHTPPVHLWAWVRQLIADACRSAGIRYHLMSSGAGHDAQVVASRYPAAMLFVPSKDGASHVPAEWTEPTDLAIGLEILLGSVLGSASD